MPEYAGVKDQIVSIEVELPERLHNLAAQAIEQTPGLSQSALIIQALSLYLMGSHDIQIVKDPETVRSLVQHFRRSAA